MCSKSVRPCTSRAAIATALLLSELVLGGIWDVLRLPRVRGVIEHLGYPTYFLVILGVWKLLGAVALVIPRFPRLKEWAYAGVVFNLTGALVSHVGTPQRLVPPTGARRQGNTFSFQQREKNVLAISSYRSAHSAQMGSSLLRKKSASRRMA